MDKQQPTAMISITVSKPPTPTATPTPNTPTPVPLPSYKYEVTKIGGFRSNRGNYYNPGCFRNSRSQANAFKNSMNNAGVYVTRRTSTRLPYCM